MSSPHSSSSGRTTSARSWRPRRKNATGGPHSRAARSPERRCAASSDRVAPAVGLALEADRRCASTAALHGSANGRSVIVATHSAMRRQRCRGVRRARRAARGRRRASSPASGSARRGGATRATTMLLCTSEATCSVAACSSIPMPPATWWPASSSKPLGNTASHWNIRCSSASSRRYDQSMVARIVLWRSTARRRPPLNRLNRSSRAPTIAGTPERRGPGRGQLDGQRDAVEPAADVLDHRAVHRLEHRRPPPRARCWNSSTPVVAGSSDRTATTCSPSMPRASRLVAITDRLGHAAVERVDHGRGAVDDVLAVVDDQQRVLAGQHRRGRRQRIGHGAERPW